MDKVIDSHLDKLEALEEEVNKIIESELETIDIASIMQNPEAELTRVMSNIRQIFLDEYADQAIELGLDFGKMINALIEKDKTIKVDNSKDPKLND